LGVNIVNPPLKQLSCQPLQWAKALKLCHLSFEIDMHNLVLPLVLKVYQLVDENVTLHPLI
jgi:hypothetical protein